jgi:hypothetical protein
MIRQSKSITFGTSPEPIAAWMRLSTARAESGQILRMREYKDKATEVKKKKRNKEINGIQVRLSTSEDRLLEANLGSKKNQFMLFCANIAK